MGAPRNQPFPSSTFRFRKFADTLITFPLDPFLTTGTLKVGRGSSALGGTLSAGRLGAAAEVVAAVAAAASSIFKLVTLNG